LSRIAVVILLSAAAAVLFFSSIRVVDSDEVALVGSGDGVRELEPGLNFVTPFSEVRKHRLVQTHTVAGDDALSVDAGRGEEVGLDCTVEVSLDRDKVVFLDRGYGPDIFAKLIRPLLLRETRAVFAEAAEIGRQVLQERTDRVVEALNLKLEPLGAQVTSLVFQDLRSLPRAAHGLKRSGGVKVFILGLDGYDWLVMEQVARGRSLENITRVRKGGAYGNLRSMEPLISPLIWTTMVTGVTPDIHGITDFLVADPQTGQEIPVTSSMRQVPALWYISSLFGRTCGFGGWCASFPAERVEGFVVTDRVAYHMFDPGWRKEGGREPGRGLTYPPELAAEVQPLVVKPEDVSARNSVASSRVANLEVFYETVDESDAFMRQGWLSLMLDFLWPF
jgi:hypothetical protein